MKKLNGEATLLIEPEILSINNKISSACSILYRRIEPLDSSEDLEEEQDNSVTDMEDIYVKKAQNSRKRAVAADPTPDKRQRRFSWALPARPRSNLPSLKDEIRMFRRVRLMLCNQDSIAESQIVSQFSKKSSTPLDKPDRLRYRLLWVSAIEKIRRQNQVSADTSKKSECLR
jgi:hypothetical protein